MGKKSRRRPRQEKNYTIDSLDDDTAKPVPPPTDAVGVYKLHYYSEHKNLEGDPSRYDKMIAAFRALDEKERRGFAYLAKQYRALFDRRVAFVSADDFDRSTGPFRWPNGRVLLKAEKDTLVSALKGLSVTKEMVAPYR